MINLFSHNLTAYESAIKMLTETGKAVIIHPTGTGKSFIAFKLCEDNKDKCILWLSPSEYIFKTQIENIRAASGGYTPNNILFYTYAKLMYIKKSDIEKIRPAYIILDEFHRCGAEIWGKGVQTVLNTYPNVPVLGLSATNIRYLDNQRDMANELFDGNVASEMTLGEAIVRGILNPPKYVLSVYRYQRDLEKYTYKVKHAKSKIIREDGEKYLEALRRALNQAKGLPEIFRKHIQNKDGKYIVFCANVKHMDEMLTYVGEWFEDIDDNPHVYKAYSIHPETSKAFVNFKKDSSEHLKLLFCIDMLNEGIHIEDISGVILLRPTVSPIVYKQQIGRALSASKTTNAVIFDIVMNIENLYSIGTIRDEMRDVMTYYRERGLENEIVNEHFTIVDEVRDCVELFEKLNDTLAASWDYMFAEAKQYYEKYGDLRVPTKYKTEQGYSLGQWLHTQRKVRRGEQFGILGENRIRKLDSIGMIWESYKDLSWNRYYSAAKKYYAEHGDLKVPASYVKGGLRLGSWISNLRTYRKNGAQSNYLTGKRITALDAIGMIWDVSDVLWERNFTAAKAYYNEHGNLDIPTTYISKDGTKLGMWLLNVRSAYLGKNKSYRLTQEQINALNKIGMIWTPRFSRAWERGYDEAIKYFKEHGNLQVPSTYIAESGYRLGTWICKQRERVGKISEERKTRLDALGFIWQKPDSWEVRYAIAKAYYCKYGDLNVPPKYIADGVWLNKWLNEQKQIYNGKRKGKSLTYEQIERLNAIGMRWNNCLKDDRMQTWNLHYEECRSYFDQYGSLNIPSGYKPLSGTNLAGWVVRQRALYKVGKLNSEQIKKLEAIGMIWELADTWEIGFSHAKEYAEHNGNLLVASNYVCDDGYRLGSWITNQRSNKNISDRYRRLSTEQVGRLESIGMVWSVSEYSWKCAYEAVLQFYKQNRHVSIPRNTIVNGIDLQTWISEQRKSYKKGKLSQARIMKLVAIGIIILPEKQIENDGKKQRWVYQR